MEVIFRIYRSPTFYRISLANNTLFFPIQKKEMGKALSYYHFAFGDFAIPRSPLYDFAFSRNDFLPNYNAASYFFSIDIFQEQKLICTLKKGGKV
jgi:hypothetical protein